MNLNRQQQIDQFLLAAHRVAMARLRAEPTRLDQVREQLARWRRISGATRSDVYWNEWDQLLVSNLDELERVVCADDEHGTVLRSVSPVSVLLTQRERAELLREARTA